MKTPIFITGNANKVKHLEKFLGYPLEHIKLDLEEIQSLDAREIVEHKVRQAYDLIQKPVLVEDGGLAFEALGRLPGPFIRFFNEEVSMETMCRMLDGMSRKALARSTFGYFDGATLRLFEGMLPGEIAQTPAGNDGWHWDRIFIPEGYQTTRASLNEAAYEKTAMALRPFAEIRAFLEQE